MYFGAFVSVPLMRVCVLLLIVPIWFWQSSERILDAPNIFTISVWIYLTGVAANAISLPLLYTAQYTSGILQIAPLSELFTIDGKDGAVES